MEDTEKNVNIALEVYSFKFKKNLTKLKFKKSNTPLGEKKEIRVVKWSRKETDGIKHGFV